MNKKRQRQRIMEGGKQGKIITFIAGKLTENIAALKVSRAVSPTKWRTKSQHAAKHDKSKFHPLRN